MKRTLLSTLVLTGALAAPAMGATITNGGFDGYGAGVANGTAVNSLTFNGWTGFKGAFADPAAAPSPANYVQVKTTAPGVGPHSGTHYLGLFGVDDGTDNHGVYQTLTDTVNGQQYTLSFYMTSQNNDDTIVNVTALDGTNLTGSVLNTVTHNNTEVDSWTEYTLTFTATSSNTTIVFQENATGVSAGSDVFIDSVSIAEVPEPGSLALLGLGALAMVRRRRA